MTHLVVLVHGFIGSPSSLGLLRDAISSASDDVMVHVSQANYGWLHSFVTTTDGIERGSTRLADEVRAVVAANANLKKISFVCVSLGGIYGRFAAHQLADVSAGTIAGLVPWRYISLASPHVGVGHSLRWAELNAMWVLWKIGLERTGAELLGFDDYAALRKLVEPPFLKSFALFKERILFANVVNDNRVDYCSAALLHAPHEHHHDDGAVESHAEILAMYNAADAKLPAGGEPLDVAERLTPVQNEMMDKLRTLSFVNVDCHLAKHPILSPMIAHSSLAGTWSLFGLQGDKSMAKVVELVTSKEATTNLTT
jgi:hypothetical protein